MKQVLVFLFFTLALALPQTPALAQRETTQKPLSNAKIEFKEKTHDFGDITEGQSVSYSFEFTNTGTEPLMILNVQTTCGCTAPEWPKKPIPPGETGTILVTFNSTKKMGRINKVITVYTNGQKPEEKLKIVTNVLPPEGATPTPEPKPASTPVPEQK